MIVGHGQMPSGVLEKVARFINGEADILLSTIIGGVDIPNANTMIIDFDRFGLSGCTNCGGGLAGTSTRPTPT